MSDVGLWVLRKMVQDGILKSWSLIIHDSVRRELIAGEYMVRDHKNRYRITIKGIAATLVDD